MTPLKLLSARFFAPREDFPPLAPLAGRGDGGEGLWQVTRLSPPHPHSLSPEAGAREVAWLRLCRAAIHPARSLSCLIVSIVCAGCVDMPDSVADARQRRADTLQPSPVLQTRATVPAQEGPDLLPPRQGTVVNQPPSGPANDATAGTLRGMYRRAADRYAAIDSYIVRLRRREQINGKDKPEELLLFKFRKQPWSVYFKWLGTEGKGREVVYVRGQYEDKIQTLLAAGDMPLSPAGKRIAISPDSIFARANSRHSINEAGIGSLIDSFGNLVDATERGDNRLGTLRYLGTLQRAEFTTACEAAEQIIPPGAEPQLPRGGRRLWAFETTSGLPTLVIAQNEVGQEVEYYCYDRFEFPVRLDDDDFNPDKLWPRKK